MQLVFVHGWGFDKSFWDDLSPLLSNHTQQRIDLGFYGQTKLGVPDNIDTILIGHSMGFIWGIRNVKNIVGWIAINSFPRFVSKDNKAGSQSLSSLRAMRNSTSKNPEGTLEVFLHILDATPPTTTKLDVNRLIWGLDELRDIDIDNDESFKTKPGLVLASNNDPLVREKISKELVTKNATLHWHETAGHVLPKTDPTWCAGKINDYLKKFERA